MDARDRFREQLRLTLGPALRSEGFAGSGSNWRMRNEHGDWAGINIQKSAWGSADSVSAYVNLSITPLPVHVFNAWFEGRAAAKQPLADSGLWTARLERPDDGSDASPGWWDFGDGSAGEKLIRAMIESIQSRGVPTLRSLLVRPTLLDYLKDDASEEVEGGYLGIWSRPAMRALILSDSGPSSELDRELKTLEREAANESDAFRSGRLRAATTWARTRAMADRVL